MPAEPQLTVPLVDPGRPTLEQVGAHPHAGRLLRCRRCGRMTWSAFGHARRHRRFCRRRDWPWGRP